MSCCFPDFSGAKARKSCKLNGNAVEAPQGEPIAETTDLLEESKAANRELEQLTDGLGQRLAVLEKNVTASQCDLQPLLVDFLVKESKIDPSIVDYVTTELQIESISDFANYFTRENYETAMREEIVAQVAAFGEKNPKSMLQVSRLRAAWTKAQNMSIWLPPPDAAKPQKIQAAPEPKDGTAAPKAAPAPVIGMGWTSPEITSTAFDGLWAALVYSASHPEEFMDVSDIVLVDRPGYLARAMTITVNQKRMEEHIYASERKGEMVYRIVNGKTKHETEDERVIAIKEEPLRLEFFHRHVSDGYRNYWNAPLEPVKAMTQKLLAHVGDAGGKGRSVVGLGVLSDEIVGVSHDALWRSMVESIREPARFFNCSDVSIQECKGFIQRTLTANGKTYVENIYDDELACEIVYRKLVDGAEEDTGRVIALRTHPLQIEFHQRNMADGFRHPWDMPKSVALGSVEGFVKEAWRMDSEKPTTIGYGVTSDPVRNCSYDSIWAAVELSIKDPWRVIDVDPSSCSIKDCRGYVHRKMKLSATGEVVVERITVNEEEREVTYCKCDASGQPSDVVRVLAVHTPLRLEFYERSTKSGLRVDWKAPYHMATGAFAKIVKLANQLEKSSADIIGFGMASKPISGVSQDTLWKAMLYAARNPDKCGMKVDTVSVLDKDGFMQRTMRLLDKPGSPTVVEHIRVIESAQEITYRPVVNNQEAEEERVFALRSDPLIFEMFCRHSTDEMRLEWQAPRCIASDIFRKVLSESQCM